MKIKDLHNFYAFQEADFIDCETNKPIYDQEKEIKDIHYIQINEEVEKICGLHEYLALHHWLTVYLILKKD